MKFGYARVSTTDQNLDLQIDALKLAQCDEIITDKISGTKSERPGLTLLRNKLRPGDTLAVWRLDRLGRSLKDLVQFVGDLEQNKIDFESLQDGINTKTATGKLTFHIFASLAEFERNLICERTKAGLEAARARGKKGGRKR
ncbi:MAG TPA: recombinase family protein, partial [Bacteroidia bacterium]|nr:recombinase family protein [Bacteroidia bacterium]